MTRVVWEIDVDSTDPVEAAKEALAAQRDPQSIATVFTVFSDKGEELATVDLRCISEREKNIPICECATAWPGQGHHPQCPVRAAIEKLTCELSTMSTERNQMLAGLEALGWPCRLVELPAHAAKSYKEIDRLRAQIKRLRQWKKWAEPQLANKERRK